MVFVRFVGTEQIGGKLPPCPRGCVPHALKTWHTEKWKHIKTGEWMPCFDMADFLNTILHKITILHKCIAYHGSASFLENIVFQTILQLDRF